MFKRLAHFAARFKTAIKAYYEGAVRSRFRTIVQTTLRDAHLDLDKASREQLQAKSRYFARNNGLYNKLADIFEIYVAGPTGLVIHPDTGDVAFDDWAASWLKQWSNVCDLTSLQSFATLQGLIARSWFYDGEVFIYKTRGESGYPRVQLIEAHRVETPPDQIHREGKSVIDGIEINQFGRPVGYWVSTSSGKEKAYKLYDAALIIHHFEPSRPGQMRGEPFVSCVINDLHDLSDIQEYEKLAAKDAAEISHILTTKTGEMTLAEMRRELGSTSQAAGNGSSTTQERVKAVSEAAGGRTIALMEGEKYEQHRNDRPSVATRELWDYLTSKVCAGVGISKLLVFPWSMQGTVTRADLDSQSAFFRARSTSLSGTINLIYIYVIGWAVANGQYKGKAPDNIFACNIRLPRSVNVDIGKNSAAVISELKAGITTFARAYGDCGLYYKAELRQKAAEIRYLKELAREFSTDGIEVTPAEISDSAIQAIDIQTQQPVIA